MTTNLCHNMLVIIQLAFGTYVAPKLRGAGCFYALPPPLRQPRYWAANVYAHAWWPVRRRCGPSAWGWCFFLTALAPSLCICVRPVNREQTITCAHHLA